jgi:putative exosortase-associated protein (TIGR04073 family)
MSINTYTLRGLLLLAVFAVSSSIHAEENQSYADIAGRKLSSGLANMAFSTLEIPKCIIIENNQPGSTVIYGITGGILEGVIHTMGRTATGILDFITAPIPTKSSINPLYIWDDFDAKNSYGPILRLQNY